MNINFGIACLLGRLYPLATLVVIFVSKASFQPENTFS
jgi:hypothetical protein